MKHDLNEVQGAETDKEDEASTSDDDENAELLTEELEERFFRVLSQLKKKDPNLYEESVKYFPSENSKEDIIQSDQKLKNKKHLKKKTEEYKDWLKGQKDKVEDEEAEKDLEALHDFWTSPNLNKEDQFLRDYILNKKFLEPDEDFDPEEEIKKLSEEEKEVEEQILFEHKYNCRFENTDSNEDDCSKKEEQETLRNKEIKEENADGTGLTESVTNNGKLKKQRPRKKKKKKELSQEGKEDARVENKEDSFKNEEQEPLLDNKIMNENTEGTGLTESVTNNGKLKKQRLRKRINKKKILPQEGGKEDANSIVQNEDSHQIRSPFTKKKRKLDENFVQSSDVKRIKSFKIGKHNKDTEMQENNKNIKNNNSPFQCKVIKKENVQNKALINEDFHQRRSPFTKKKRKLGENFEQPTDVKKIKSCRIDEHNKDTGKQAHNNNTEINNLSLEKKLKKKGNLENFTAVKQGNEGVEISKKFAMKVKNGKKKKLRYRNKKVLMKLVSPEAVSGNKMESTNPPQVSANSQMKKKIHQDNSPKHLSKSFKNISASNQKESKIRQINNSKHFNKHYKRKKHTQVLWKKNKQYQGEIKKESKEFKIIESIHKKRKRKHKHN